MSFRLVGRITEWQRGGMAHEYSALPESFSAGTTVRYRKRLSDFPATAGWTLKLHLAGASVRSATAAADGDDFVVTIAATDTESSFAAGLYQWTERVSNIAGEVYEVASGIVTVVANLAEATEGSEQQWIERSVAVLKAHIEGRLAAGMESYQIAGRVVAKMPIKEAVGLLTTLESRLARLRNPDFITRPVLVSFTGPGFER
ncbi:hypothetical protein KJ554_01840 [bacterium]|nr:hypothetical protein [bacterium]